MKLLAFFSPNVPSPYMKFAWIVAGLLGAFTLSMAFRQQSRLRLQSADGKRAIVPRAPATEEDRRLKEDLERALDRVLSVKGSVLVEVIDGKATLLGQALVTDLDTLLKTARSVPGLRTLNNRLEVHDASAIAPELARPRQRRRGSEIPASPTSLDSFDEESGFESKS